MLPEFQLGISIVNGLIKLFRSIWGLFSRKPKQEDIHDSTAPIMVAKRFVTLFEEHGVKRSQIPSFFGHGFTLEKLKDDETLLSVLSEEQIQAACELFAVRREWLDGVETEIYPRHHFYKHPEYFLEFIKNIKSTNADTELYGAVIAPLGKGRHETALLIMQESVGYIGDKPIYRYHLCDTWVFSYWESRAYLTACTAVAWKNSAYVYGIQVQKNEIDKIASGEVLIGWGGEGFTALGHKSWYPEDMALRPDVYLDGIDPEQGGFGLRAALSHWLMLDEKGYMDIGIKGEHRKTFQEELNKLANN